MTAPNPARKDALIASAVILVVAVGMLVFVFTNFRLTPASSPEPSTPSPSAYDEGATRGGDAAPHQRENREHLRPKDLTEETRQRLDAEGAKLSPALEQVRESGDITPDSVRSALLGAGYPDETVSTVFRMLPADGTTQYVVFGIEFEDGCVAGMVTPTEVDAQAMGRIPEWGCLPPDTH